MCKRQHSIRSSERIITVTPNVIGRGLREMPGYHLREKEDRCLRKANLGSCEGYTRSPAMELNLSLDGIQALSFQGRSTWPS